MNYLYAFSLAWALCTRVPLPKGCYPVQITPHLQSLSVSFYPLVGLLLGALLLMLYAVLPAHTGALFSAVILVCVWVALTGAMHLDGLADSVDAYCAGHKGDAVAMKVFKDPASGPMAVAAVVLVLLLKVAALAVLLEQQQLFALFAALFVSRWLLFPAMAFTPYVRERGMASEMLLKPFVKRWLLVSGIGLIIVMAVAPLAAFWFIAAAGLAFVWRRMWMKTIGGFVGDCLGAQVELTEALILVLAVLSCC